MIVNPFSPPINPLLAVMFPVIVAELAINFPSLSTEKVPVPLLNEVEEIMNNKPGFIYASWCGDQECELKMKEIRGTKSRCIVENYTDEHEHTCVVCGKKAKHNVVWGIQY